MVVAGRGELLPTATKAGEAWYLKLLPLQPPEEEGGGETGGRKKRSIPRQAQGHEGVMVVVVGRAGPAGASECRVTTRLSLG